LTRNLDRFRLDCSLLITVSKPSLLTAKIPDLEQMVYFILLRFLKKKYQLIKIKRRLIPNKIISSASDSLDTVHIISPIREVRRIMVKNRKREIALKKLFLAHLFSESKSFIQLASILK